MAAPSVHSCLPPGPAGTLGANLPGGVEHVAADPERGMAAAEAAIADERCIAFVGPLRSWAVAETAAMLNEAGIAQLAPAATWSALTRDEPGAVDGAPASLSPTGRRTLFRLVPRDTVVCAALVQAAAGPLEVVEDGSAYGRQIAEQLALAGLEPAVGADGVVYAGLGAGAPLERLRAAATVLAFEGAAEPTFAEALPNARFHLSQRPTDGFADADAIAYVPAALEAALLLTGSLMAAGPSRSGIVEALAGCGRFDEHGDTVECRVGVWRYVDGEWRGEAVIGRPPSPAAGTRRGRRGGG